MKSISLKWIDSPETFEENGDLWEVTFSLNGEKHFIGNFHKKEMSQTPNRCSTKIKEIMDASPKEKS